MGFRKPDLAPAYEAIRTSVREIGHPGNDGFTGSYCKRDLYQLKCWLEDQYNSLPTFSGEEEWEQQRIVDILKRP
jgi:hypothetical protein